MANIDALSMRKFSYGLFALFTNDGAKDNACIINTAQQLTDNPKRITIAVNKSNYSCDTIKKTGIFNISVLTENCPFDIFTRFGFASGRDTDKLDGFDSVMTSENGLKYLSEYSNCFMSAKVIDSADYGTHTLFVAEITEAKVLNDMPSVTYAYYFANIKPGANKPEVKSEQKKIVGWRCIICGYEYKGEALPSDFVCPLCKHPASDFEPIYE
jgi:flavin reductase (DIM6/NTAB) family NADH-FMN oxidoreductase RutF/rubredoxin